MAETVGHIVQDLTEGRPFVFMIMAFKDKKLGDFYKKVIQPAVKVETGLKCIRADEVPGSGHDLLQKVHLLIDRAELVIAEISSKKENVFYEVGYALAKNKAMVFLAASNRKIPTDLKGRELIRHGPGKAEQFKREFREHLRARLGAKFALLRDMLLADNPTPAYIVASPRYPGVESRILGQRFDSRTFGDNAGIRGLLQAFGAIIGEGAGVELVSAQYCHPMVISRHYQHPAPFADPVGEPVSGPVNLYLIGSKKVNPPAGFMLDRIQMRYREGRRWYLGRIPKDQENGDYPCGLYLMDGTKCKKKQGVFFKTPKDMKMVHRTDYGIVVRAPHPDEASNSGRLVVILAGGHSLGTAAACMAATRSSLIRAIREKLPGTHEFEDKTRAFWALIKGTANNDGMLDEAGVHVESADWYEPRG